MDNASQLALKDAAEWSKGVITLSAIVGGGDPNSGGNKKAIFLAEHLPDMLAMTVKGFAQAIGDEISSWYK